MKTANLNRNKFLNNLLNILIYTFLSKEDCSSLYKIDAVTIKY